MGSAQSLATPQNSVAAVLLVAVVATVWYRGPSSAADKSAPTGKKGKKKKAAGASQDTSQNRVAGPVPGERTVPGGIPEPVADAPTTKPEVSKSVKEKKRKSKKSAASVDSGAGSEDIASTAPVAGPSGTVVAGSQTPSNTAPKRTSPAHESWTRVESRRRSSAAGQNPTTSDAGLTTATSVTEEDGSSSGTVEKTGDEGKKSRPQKTLAEKVLPKGRKTAVDDMLDASQYPELSRVMRVAPATDEKPASGFSWGDYEDAEEIRGADADGEDDGGWGVVKSRGKAKHSQSYTGASATQQPKAPETLTKKQRQHAAKRDAAKAAKADAEAERLAQLASHKQALERTRITEQYSRKGSSSGRSGVVSGGMTASVDDKGQLVWD